MFTYFDLSNVGAHIIQAEQLSNDGGDGGKLFDLNKYPGANINDAVALEMNKVYYISLYQSYYCYFLQYNLSLVFA